MNVQEPTRSVNDTRYQLKARAESRAESRAGSPQQYKATPPRSPMKFTSAAQESVARVAASQTYTKPAISRSPLASPSLNQKRPEHDKPVIREESALRAKSPNQIVPSRSPEPTRPTKPQKSSLAAKISQTFRPPKSPEPPRSTDSPEPQRARVAFDTDKGIKRSEPGRDMKSPEPARSALSPDPLKSTRTPILNVPRDSPEPVRSADSSSPNSWNHRVEEPKPTETLPSGTESASSHKVHGLKPDQMHESPTSPVPERVPSRRTSLTKRTRDLLHRKPPFARERDEDTLSAPYLPIQSPSAEHTPAKRPTSPVTTSIVRRASSRAAKALSMSTYSDSPTSPTKPASETPPIREASPALTRDGKPVPAQSEYAVLSLQPMQPLSPLDPFRERPAIAPNAQRADLLASATTPPTSIIKSRNNSGDTEGNVNTNHPLLQTARHTRFARNSNGDLPLRHYHSQGAFTHSNPDLAQRRSDEKERPKRSSSLLYKPETRFRPSPELDRSKSATPTQCRETPNMPTPSHLPMSTMSAESELGIHPAHRMHDVPSTSADVSSPTFSTNSSLTEHGATPPPIATTRESQQATPRAISPAMSPPSRFAPPPPSQLRKPPEKLTEASNESDWQPQHRSQRSTDSSSTPVTSNEPNSKTAAANNTPFYLNPASSSALIDFLATTPPPSPPHPGTKLNRDLTPSPAPTSSNGAFFNRPFAINHPQDGEASPPPPAPGSRSMVHLGRINSGDLEREKAKKGWKKIFGVGRGAKKSSQLNGGKSVNGKKKKGDLSKCDEMNGPMSNGGSAGAGNINHMGLHSDGGFVGMGPDGNWISRQNFVKT